MRCVHEASLFDCNSFLTLTYSDEHLPRGGTLVKKHFQDFMKRLRRKFPDSPIRYFHCGEYGDVSRRPHYHACVFNFVFLDSVLYKTVNGNKLSTSPTLDKLWGMGFCTIGDVTFDSAAYVARYIMKKVTGDLAVEHYRSFDPDTGECIDLLPEYTTMSRRPGIGRDWYDLYNDEVRSSDSVVMRGREMKPPRYYDSIYEISDPDEFERLKEERRQSVVVSENSRERLAVREQCKVAQISTLTRSLDDEV